VSLPEPSVPRRYPRFARRWVCTGIVAACVGLAGLIEWLTTSPASRRDIHIEAFRYGVWPSILRVNRGDDLRLTFSTRDTGHSFFLQDYGIDAKITPQVDGTVEVYDPARATDAPRKMSEVRLTAGRPGLLGQLNTVSRHRCHVYCGPMHGFEQGDMIVRPNWLFAIAFGILVALPLVGWYRIRTGPDRLGDACPPVDLFVQFPWLRRIIRWRPLQFSVTLPVLALFLVLQRLFLHDFSLANLIDRS